MEANIVLLPGDGIGPEVVTAASKVLEAVAKKFGHRFQLTQGLIGGASIDACGSALSDETLSICRAADAVLLGAVGDPKFDVPTAKVRPEQGLLALRKGLGVFANLRPVKVLPCLADSSPVKPERLAGVDMMVVRELTGGLYFGQPRKREQRGEQWVAIDTLEYSSTEIERLVRLGFELAVSRRNKLASVDKANVLESSRLWREIVNRVAKEYPQVSVEHVLVDTAAMRLVSNPAAFDVVVTENMFGDILTDEASVLSGSMGLLPSASLGAGTLGLYEPIHGSAPDIAGKGVANPLGTILSAALLLRYSLKLEKEAGMVEKAVDTVLEGGARTRDLGGKLTTLEMTSLVLDQLT